jgi:hypothetical protein
MAHFAVFSALSLMVATTTLSHAQDASGDEVQKVADQAGVSPEDLTAALATMHDAGYDLSAAEYLCRTDGVVCPDPPRAVSDCGWPICGPLGQRLYCIEQHESQHNGGAVNRYSGAAGYLQWLPSTAARWGVQIGNRWSEWTAAARIAALGEPFFRSQWTTLQRGLC